MPSKIFAEGMQRACWPGSRSSWITSRKSACRKEYPVSSTVRTAASIASRMALQVPSRHPPPLRAARDQHGFPRTANAVFAAPGRRGSRRVQRVAQRVRRSTATGRRSGELFDEVRNALAALVDQIDHHVARRPFHQLGQQLGDLSALQIGYIDAYGAREATHLGQERTQWMATVSSSVRYVVMIITGASAKARAKKRST